MPGISYQKTVSAATSNWGQAMGNGHVEPVGVGPPPRILVVVRIVHCVVELVIHLRQSEQV